MFVIFPLFPEKNQRIVARIAICDLQIKTLINRYVGVSLKGTKLNRLFKPKVNDQILKLLDFSFNVLSEFIDIEELVSKNPYQNISTSLASKKKCSADLFLSPTTRAWQTTTLLAIYGSNILTPIHLLSMTYM